MMLVVGKQKCPVCNGTGLVSIPPGVAGDQPTFSSSESGPWQCRVCGGKGMIWGPSPAPLPTETAPALTAEEWQNQFDPDAPQFPRPQDDCYEYWGPAHEVAALALYKQPFGFTQEDVRHLRFLAGDVLGSSMPAGRHLLGLAARIAALLPPA